MGKKKVQARCRNAARKTAETASALKTWVLLMAPEARRLHDDLTFYGLNNRGIDSLHESSAQDDQLRHRLTTLQVSMKELVESFEKVVTAIHGKHTGRIR